MGLRSVVVLGLGTTLAVGCGGDDNGGSDGSGFGGSSASGGTLASGASAGTNAGGSSAGGQGGASAGSAGDGGSGQGGSGAGQAGSGQGGSGGQAGSAGQGGTGGGSGTAELAWEPQAWENCEGGGQQLTAGPGNYRDVLPTLQPGDTLTLQAGSYDRGLPVTDLNGTANACIVIQGPADGNRATFTGSDSFNLIAFRRSSYVKVRHFDLDGENKAGFGVATQDAPNPVHHVVIEDLHMVGFGANQQIVGISTKTPAWDWVIRGNTIIGAGTGMYLGNSDGQQPFIRGVVELNTVVDTIGYNIQIKHQNGRVDLPGIPTQAETIIRYNVLSKQNGGSSGGNARPNLLLGHFPTSGSGANDRYVVYGNLLHDNPNENLFQGEGNIAFFSNLAINPNGGAIVIQPHNDVPRSIDVFFNTVIASGSGIRVSGGDAAFTQQVVGNAIFAGTPLSAGTSSDNHEGSVTDAASALEDSSGTLDSAGDLDLRPRPGQLEGSQVDMSAIVGLPGADVDFCGLPRDTSFRGAYSAPASAACWSLQRQAPTY